VRQRRSRRETALHCRELDWQDNTAVASCIDVRYVPTLRYVRLNQRRCTACHVVKSLSVCQRGSSSVTDRWTDGQTISTRRQHETYTCHGFIIGRCLTTDDELCESCWSRYGTVTWRWVRLIYASVSTATDTWLYYLTETYSVISSILKHRKTLRFISRQTSLRLLLMSDRGRQDLKRTSLIIIIIKIIIIIITRCWHVTVTFMSEVKSEYRNLWYL